MQERETRLQYGDLSPVLQTVKLRLRFSRATAAAAVVYGFFLLPVLWTQPSTIILALWCVLGIGPTVAAYMLAAHPPQSSGSPSPLSTAQIHSQAEQVAAMRFADSFPDHVPGCPYCRSRRVRISPNDPEDIFCTSCRHFFLRSYALLCWRTYFKLQAYAAVYGLKFVMAHWQPAENPGVTRGRHSLLPCDAPDTLDALLAVINSAVQPERAT